MPFFSTFKYSFHVCGHYLSKFSTYPLLVCPIHPSLFTVYFNIIINIIIATDPTFSKVKIFNVLFSHHKFFVKMFFHYITTIFTFFDHINNKIVNSIFNSVCLKRLTKLIIDIQQFIAITASNIFLIFVCMRLFWIFSFCCLLVLKYFQNLQKL